MVGMDCKMKVNGLQLPERDGLEAIHRQYIQALIDA